MSWLDRLRNVFRPDALSDDIDREMAFHIEQRADSLVAAGMSRERARDEARRRFGNPGIQKDRTRERDLFGWLNTVAADLRYAVRGIRAAPGFAAVAILSLALGIGANTAIFTLLNVAMFKPLPVGDPEELVVVTLSSVADSKGGSSFSDATWRAFRDRQDVFASAFVYGSTGSGDLSTGGEMRPVPVGLVSGEFFSTLGVHPAAGRLLVGADDHPGCPGVVVLTHSFWRSEFGADPSVVGRTLQITGNPFRVVGVAEPRFFGLGFGYYPPVWTAQCAGSMIRGPSYRPGGTVIARLKPGVSLEHAQARVSALWPAVLEASAPAGASALALEQRRAITARVTSFEKGFRFIRDEYGRTLLVLMGIVGIVLLIACVNVANLLLARATARRGEFGMRLALGAGRGRLIRQLLTESLALAAAGAAAGVLFAIWGSRALVSLLSQQGRPMLAELSPDLNVLLFTIAVAGLTALVFGVAPAWRAVRVSERSVMVPNARGGIEGYSRFSLAKGLVAVQLALSMMMLVAAALLIGSWRHLVALDPGFDADDVLVVSVATRPSGIADSLRHPAFAEILARLRGIPGLAVASAALRTPIGSSGWRASLVVDDGRSDATRPVVEANEITDGYFAATGTRLIAGRDFDSGDKHGSAKVAIVNEELARRHFGAAMAVGRRIAIDWGAGRGVERYEIVAVVANTRDQTLIEPDLPQVYFPLWQSPVAWSDIRFVIRATNVRALAPGVTSVIMGAHPRFSLRTRLLQDYVNDSTRIQRTLSTLAGFFGALALLLASIGLYGVMAYNVARRKGEIGLRIALGADQRRIVRIVLADVARIVGAGLTIGVAAALATTHLMAKFLFGVEPRDLPSLVVAAVLLAVVACGAAWVPARRASRLDPVVALRAN